MSWLKSYYGKAFNDFKPQVVEDGEEFAVVQITRTVPRGFSGIGFVLVKKTANFQNDRQKSLHEGPLTKAARKKMKDELRKAEEK